MSTPTVAPAPRGEQAAPGSPELFNRRTIVAMELSTDVSLFEIVETTAKLARLTHLALYGLLQYEMHVGTDAYDRDIKLIQELAYGADWYAESAESMCAKAAGIEGDGRLATAPRAVAS
jgi:hypothetical protein